MFSEVPCNKVMVLVKKQMVTNIPRLSIWVIYKGIFPEWSSMKNRSLIVIILGVFSVFELLSNDEDSASPLFLNASSKFPFPIQTQQEFDSKK